MRFWDASAIVPLLIRERDSKPCRDAFINDPEISVWAATRVEIASALARRLRAGEIDEEEHTYASSRAARYAAAWQECDDLHDVLELAQILIATYPLRAADAQQLAAALLPAKGYPKDRVFVTRDEPLAAAAEAERFVVILPVAT